MKVKLAWILFFLFAAALVGIPRLLHSLIPPVFGAEEQVQLECDATHCRIEKRHLLLLLTYIERLQAKVAKGTCT